MKGAAVSSWFARELYGLERGDRIDRQGFVMPTG